MIFVKEKNVRKKSMYIQYDSNFKVLNEKDQMKLIKMLNSFSLISCNNPA